MTPVPLPYRGVKSLSISLINMKIYSLFSTLLLFVLPVLVRPLSAEAQTVDVHVLDFGPVATGTTDSLPIAVHLGGHKALKINVWLAGEGFGTSQRHKTLTRGGDTTVWIRFAPRHNVSYRGLVVCAFEGVYNAHVALKGEGSLDNPYYKTTFDLWDAALVSELRKVIKGGQKSLGYNGARDKMYGSLDNVAGKVSCVYTGRVAAFTTRSGANDNNFNCEHTWPQSKFCSGESDVMVADLHHLFPTDVTSNSRRANYPFGMVEGSVQWQEGGSKLGGGVFEPRNEHKGAAARAVLYMALRYGNCEGFLGNQESVLREWSSQYAPSALETTRNEGIYKLQNNRNPFVDEPLFLERMVDVEGKKNREWRARPLSPDTVLLAVKQTIDSFVYWVYVVNDGREALHIAQVDAPAAAVGLYGKTLEMGQMARIRLAYAKGQPPKQRVRVLFQETYLSPLSIRLEVAVGQDPSLAGAVASMRVANGMAYYMGPGLAQVQLYAINGTLVGNWALHPGVNSLHGFGPGVYILAWPTAQGVIRQKLVLP
jgi:endonuclease I